MDKGKITKLDAKTSKEFRKSKSGGKTAITGLKFKGSEVDSSVTKVMKAKKSYYILEKKTQY